MVFNQLCHGCGSCTTNCPESAISEELYVIGVLERGVTQDGIIFAHGLMNIGEPMAVPVIRQLKEWMIEDDFRTIILDVSPGASCPVVEFIRQSDYLLLVTEPTPFGLHDLKLAVRLAHELNLPHGVIINRDGIGNQKVEQFCQKEHIPILGRIPYQRQIAQALAQGNNLVDCSPDYQDFFLNIFSQILAQAGLKLAP